MKNTKLFYRKQIAIYGILFSIITIYQFYYKLGAIIDDDDGLSGGIIALIVILCVLFVVGCCCCCWFIIFIVAKRRRKDKKESEGWFVVHVNDFINNNVTFQAKTSPVYTSKFATSITFVRKGIYDFLSH